MRKSIYLLIIFPLIGMLAFMGCEGPEGPAGPTGTDGSDGGEGPPGPEGRIGLYSYIGDNGNTCGHCHSGNVEEWSGTGHSHAYESLVEGGNEGNIYCLQCHTTGFDAPVASGDTVITDHGSDVNGYDDYFPPETAEDSTRLEALESVQCESCHGNMGPTIYDHAPDLSYATVLDGEPTAACTKCHGETVEQWAESGHGKVLETHEFSLEEFSAEFNRSSCWTCHTTEGFIYTWDPMQKGILDYQETANLIGCAACHDPHSSKNEKHLRELGDVTVLYTVNEEAEFTGWGPAQLCAQCHHGRRDNANVTGQIANGSRHLGPHGSPQMDMFVGAGSYEIEGYEYDRGNNHNMIQDENESCVTCHIEAVEEHGRTSHNHSFEVKPVNCQVCHLAMPDDFNINGLITEIDGLLEELAAAIGAPEESWGDAEVTTPEQRMAAYTYAFVANDGSHGVHNPQYTRSLLNNAIAFMDTINNP